MTVNNNYQNYYINYLNFKRPIQNNNNNTVDYNAISNSKQNQNIQQEKNQYMQKLEKNKMFDPRYQQRIQEKAAEITGTGQNLNIIA